ncbi:MAG: DUF5606 domain-containing protein [Catalinimonas sp.]
MELQKIAAVAGKPGLFRVLKPTRTGVVLEPLDGTGGRFAAGASSRVSVLKEISIYVTDEDGSEPLEAVMDKLYAQQAGGRVDIAPQKAPEAELRDFMSELLPNYDASRVYASDIKKLITWYNLIVTHEPDAFKKPEEVDTGTDAPDEAPDAEGTPEA